MDEGKTVARIRSIHPSLFSDEAFVTLSDAAKWFFIGLWTEADDRGVFEWKPITLKMRIAPASTLLADPLLSEMEQLDRIRRYEIDGHQYGAIRNFTKYQRPKFPKYRFPITDDIRSYITPGDSITEIDHDDGTPVPRKGEIVSQMEDGGGSKKKIISSSQPVTSARDGLPPSAFEKICEALGGFEAIRKWTNLREMTAFWLGEADLETEILPAIREVLAKRGGKLPTGAGYFTGAIRDARDRRLAGKQNGNGHAPQQPFVERGEWMDRMRVWKDKKLWGPTWGAKPGADGCQVPADLIAEYAAS